MLAQRIYSYGDQSEVRLEDIPLPGVSHGHVLVRVHAAGVNPIDNKIRRNSPAFAPTPPAVLGMDMAGVVEAVGPGVAHFKPGDEVYGAPGGLAHRPGSFAQYMAADARLVAMKPAKLSMRQAAAMPLVTITAWEAVIERLGVTPGQQVLVHGGAGGVGHIAVQLGRILGAHVCATVSSDKKAELAAALGASDTVNYRAETVADYTARLTAGKGFDAVLDTVGGQTLDDSFTAARHGGQVATTNARSTHDLSPMHAKGLSLHVVFMLLPLILGRGLSRHGAILRQAARLADEGRLSPLLDPATFSLAELPHALDHLESGRAVGKVVVDIP